jgi:hypothetical protein
MKKKIDTSQNDERIRAHLKMLNARLAAEQAAERKLTVIDEARGTLL